MYIIELMVVYTLFFSIRICFIFLIIWGHWSHSGKFKIELLKPVLVFVNNVAPYNIVYEDKQYI